MRYIQSGERKWLKRQDSMHNNKKDRLHVFPNLDLGSGEVGGE